jgi:hypothetical protein
MIKDATDGNVPNAHFIVSHARREEKGSDVNVASRLLLDLFTSQIEAAVVISNDSGLRLPIQEVRQRIPVGTVNPSKNYLAGQLMGKPSDGVGNHWWRQLKKAEFTAHQLPDPAGGHVKPAGW